MKQKRMIGGTDIPLFSYRAFRFVTLMFFFTIIAILIAAFYQLGNILAYLFKRKNPAAGTKAGDFDLVCYSHVDWFNVWQRNHHTMMQLARKRKVLYLHMLRTEELAEVWSDIFFIFRYIKVVERQDNVFYGTPLVLFGEGRIFLFKKINQWICTVYTRRAIRKCKFDSENIVLWFYFPWRHYVVGTLNEKLVTYDIQDEYSAFEWAPRYIGDFEQALLKKADLVFTGTNSLYEKRKQYHDNIHFVQCGVDNEHFAKASDEDMEIPDDIAWLPRPILGYFGIVEWRMDRELLSYAAQKHPDWSLVMIGPVNKSVPFPREDNLYFLGGKNYKYLPNYTKAFDICMMPFAMNELTKNINPTKLLEYLAAGKPVISTAIPDVIKYYSGLVEIAHTKEEFVELAEKLLREDGQKRILTGVERARQSSWGAMARFMEEKMKEGIAKRSGSKEGSA